MANLTGDELVYDLYTGTGTIANFVARNSKKVVGIEYVEDPATHKRVPTVNRAQFTSVFMDEDYKSAIEYADPVQKSVYEAEAKAIDEKLAAYFKELGL